MEELLVKVHDQTIGPLSLKKFEKLVDQGIISGLNLVREPDSENWLQAGKVPTLSYLFAQNGQETPYRRKIYAIASGKGGVGKTVTAASLGVGLASMGHRVIVVDADFGGANLHTCMGILKPEHNFNDFYNDSKRPLSDFVVDTPIHNLKMISGTCGTMDLANPKYHQKLRLIRGLRKLAADYIILDLGAGSDYNVLDLFLLADERLLVISTEPPAIHEAFGFIKVCFLRGLQHTLHKHDKALEVIRGAEKFRPGEVQLTAGELLNEIGQKDPDARFKAVSFMNAFEPRLILNKVRSKDELKEGLTIQYAAWELLSLRTDYLGYISYDPKVSEAVSNFRPFLLYDSKARASQDITALIRVKLMQQQGLGELFAKRSWSKKLSRQSATYPRVELLEDAPICSDACFYWDNCNYQNEGKTCPVRHLESTFVSKTP